MISIQNVHAGYGENEILHGITFDVKMGENLSIIGPNGCGKTTLLRTIAGTMPFTGDILCKEESIRKMKRRTLAKKISLLSQTIQVYFNYTVFDTIMMGRYVHESNGLFGGISEKDKLAVNEALETVGMLELKDREVDTLSGGQLQRVFLAKVLAQDPDIILLDEPTNHLDFSYQIEMIRFLKQWAVQKKKTVIGVLHDINLAMQLSDRILLLDDGKIHAFGYCRDIFTSDALNSAYKMDVAGYMLETLKKWEDILAPQHLVL